MVLRQVLGIHYLNQFLCICHFTCRAITDYIQRLCRSRHAFDLVKNGMRELAAKKERDGEESASC